MKLPQVISSQITDKYQAKIELKLQPELFWFKGHFPEMAILPGVAQITWVMHYANTLLDLNLLFNEMDVVKFQRPLLANETVTLELIWDTNTQKLSFKYLRSRADNQEVASSGRIRLCQ